jgi:hypothetical protein
MVESIPKDCREWQVNAANASGPAELFAVNGTAPCFFEGLDRCATASVRCPQMRSLLKSCLREF